jgi:hypothetical protein
MKINSVSDLPIETEVCLGNDMACNFYTRHKNDSVTVQHYYRYGKSPEPYIMTKENFNAWRKEIAMS